MTGGHEPAGAPDDEASSASRPLQWTALVVCIAVIAWCGLYPFEFTRRNAASWLQPGPGMRFEDGGFARTRAPLAWEPPAELGMEIWLRTVEMPPESQRTFLVLLDEATRRYSVMGMRQEGRDVVWWDRVVNPDGEVWYNDFRIVDVLLAGRLQHLAVSARGRSLRFYVDGRRVDATEGFSIPIAQGEGSFGGLLVVGAGPPWTEPWSGEILGLTLSARAPTDAEVARRNTAGAPAGEGGDGVLAVHAFDAGTGSLVVDRSGHGHDLVVPEYYRPPIPRLLVTPRWRYWRQPWFLIDAALNLAGFVPIGALLFLVFRSAAGGGGYRQVLLVTLIGGCASLAIEVSQSLMVSRTSSLLDLCLNTSGTLVGAWGAGAWIARVARRPG